MICIKADIPQSVCEIDDECKAIYHSRDSVCIFVFASAHLRNRFMAQTAGMNKAQREAAYARYAAADIKP